MGQSPGRRPRVVVVSPALPRLGAPDAGTRYLDVLVRTLAEDADVSVLVPDFEDAAHGTVSNAAGLATYVLRTLPSPVRVALRRFYLLAARCDPTLPYFPFALELVRGSAGELLRDADVVDLQWPETLRLARLVRRVNPGAVVLVTHHDVGSQRAERQVPLAGRARSRWARRWYAVRARRAERRSARFADAGIAFSEEDAALLTRTGAPRATVVRPPLARSTGDGPDLAEREHLVLFVGYLARPENDDAARWLVADIWPGVAARVPGARLLLAGAGAGADLVGEVARREDVELTGFVEDLDALHHRARACVVPLRRGAGVKFKTIEALLAGTPVVTTTVGAEGVAGPQRFVRVADDAAGLVDGLVEALDAPDQAAASRTRDWAGSEFGTGPFRESVRRLYGLTGT